MIFIVIKMPFVVVSCRSQTRNANSFVRILIATALFLSFLHVVASHEIHLHAAHRQPVLSENRSHEIIYISLGVHSGKSKQIIASQRKSFAHVPTCTRFLNALLLAYIITLAFKTFQF